MIEFAIVAALILFGAAKAAITGWLIARTLNKNQRKGAVIGAIVGGSITSAILLFSFLLLRGN